jgi:hypothetical protein
VGNDVCPDGNSPSQSKHEFLSTWRHPEIVCNIAKDIGFASFTASTFTILNCRFTPLCAKTITHEYTDAVAPIWTNEVQRVFKDVKTAILSNPCLMHFNQCRSNSLKTK